jgi:hypothetical protein
MNQKTEIQKIKVNNGQELINKAKEYKNLGGEWKLQERYIEMPTSSSKIGRYRKNKLGWGVIISNGKQTINIFSPRSNVDYEELVEKDLVRFDEINVRNELFQLFPEAKFALSNYGDSKLSPSTYKHLKKDNEEYDLRRYLVAESSWHLSQIVHQWVQENKTAIQQSPNSDFASWVEIIDGQDGNMYLYVGKKNDNGGREIKIGIKKDKYFEEVEGIEGNRKRGGDGFYNAGEHLEINWDLMLITIDFVGWPLKFKERKNNDQPGPRAIKEKILRNLDKVCLDPMGEIANAEKLKEGRSDILNYYQKGTYENNLEGLLTTTAYQVEIEGEKIDLTQFVNGHWEDYLEIKHALVNEIKQNPGEWKIEETLEKPNRAIIKHKSGRRHWKVGFIYFRESLKEAKKQWAEMEALVKGQPLPVAKISDTEKSQLLNYFLKYSIKKVSFADGKLIIEYKNNTAKTAEEDQQLQKYHQLIKTLPSQSLSLSDLQENNTNNPSTSDKNNTGTYLVLAIGAFILGGVFVYFLARKKKK